MLFTWLHVRIGIILTCGRHINDRIISLRGYIYIFIFINIYYLEGGRISAPEIGRNAQQYFSYFVVVSLLSVEETGVLWSRIATG